MKAWYRIQFWTQDALGNTSHGACMVEAVSVGTAESLAHSYLKARLQPEEAGWKQPFRITMVQETDIAHVWALPEENKECES